MKREVRANGMAVPIGSRAFEIIETLVQAAGGLVTKDDLMTRVWPGVIVEDNTVQVHISAIRKALAADRGMLKTVSGRGYRLLGGWTIRRESVPPKLDVPEPPRAGGRPFLTNVPVAASALIGRETAVRHLCDLASAYRVVTLTGPGGIGKTVLASEVCRRLFPTIESDVLFAELASLSNPELVPSRVAYVLNLQLRGDEMAPEAVARAIGSRKVLLVLDNCEHLIDAAARMAETLLRLCPHATVLATSREVLRIEGEFVYRVTALDVPAQHMDATDEVLEHGAVQLFVARTRSLRADFRPQGDSLPVIATICRRLDGIPLAIEFAAARAATLGVQQVARRLDDRFALLTGGRRTALPRHQTLRATLDWSYELLSEREQHLLRHLAVFPGGFTIEAAAAINGGSESDTQIAERISSLVWKSLLTLVGSTGGPRWRLLETTRAYALEKLAENGEREQAARRQAEFFRDLFAPTKGGPLVTLDELPHYVREIDNVRAALDWAFSRGGEKAVGIALTAAYAPVWLHWPLIAECRAHVARARDNLGADSGLSPRLRAQLLTMLGLVLVYTGAADERSASVLAEALNVAESLGDPEAQLQALYAIWTHRFINGDLGTTHKLAERIALIAPHTGDSADMQVADRLLGTTYHYLGDQRQAQHRFESALNRYTAPSGRRRVMWLLFDGRVIPQTRLARVLWMRGLAEGALQVAKASLEDARAAGHELSMCFALSEALCPLHLMAGDIRAATQYVTMLSELVTRNGFLMSRFEHFEGVLSIKRGDAAQGVTKLRSALGDFSSAGQALIGSELVGDFAEALACQGNLVEASTVIDNALARSQRDGVLWHMPELLRMKAELSIRQFGDRSFSAAEHLFSEAMEMAGEQAALFWQLRVAVSLARLKIRQHRAIEARTILAPVCEAFAVTAEFSDLGAARELLNTLPTAG